MLNFLAISYNNIGPFKNTPLTIFFETGKYLIKAPIGSGKSFLFFDGPIYGLYKYSARNMLNNQSKEGTIKLLFELEGETWLITRTISKAKSKESCTSKLFKIQTQGDINFRGGDEKEILQYNQDIQQILKQHSCDLEEIIFKNETDLQQTFQNMLPPREVFLNTVFLMQDSDNIFELLPSERLNVLKNVFGLLGIDEAKDVITEKRKEVSYKLKAYSDTSKYDEKIKQFVSGYTSSYDILLSNTQKLSTESIQPSANIEELKAIQEKLSINDLNDEVFSPDNIGQIDTIISDKKNSYQKLQQQIQNYQEENKKKKNTIDAKRQERIIVEKDNGELIKNIKNLNPEILTQLKSQKQTLITTQETLEKSYAKTPTELFLNNQENQNIIGDFAHSTTINLTNTYLLIQHLTNKGKALQEEISKLQLQIKNEELKQSHAKEKIETEIKNLTDRENSLTTQLNQIISTIKEFDANIDTQATFHCEKTADNCPFIKIINKKTFDQLDIQKQQFLKQKSDIELQIDTIKTNITQHKTALQSQTQTQENNQIKEYTLAIQTCEQDIQKIRNFLTDIDRKSIQTNYTTYTKTQEEISILDKQIIQQELLQQQIESFKQQKEKNEGILTTLDEQIQSLLKEQTEIEELLLTQTTILGKISYDTILTAEKLIIQINNYQRDIISLIQDYKKIQLEVHQLKEEEKQLNNLYLIFSKELLLLVLQDHLPILNDIINDQLSKVVDYQISLTLSRSNSEKLELEANIIDHQGQREIKSLSGGQKIILKLVWMIAISSYMNSPILFLDETINNLDIDTVSKVADMLEEFVKQRNMKVYTVTHNQQIQDMNIRDQSIEVKPNPRLA